MARPKKPATGEAADASDENAASGDESSALEDGKILDYITGKPVAENDKERVRQRIARAMFHEYGISVDDMEPDFRVKVGSLESSVVWKTLKTSFHQSLAKVRIFCHPDHLKVVEA